MNTGVSVEMPCYRCYKEVHALKIKDIQFEDSPALGATIVPVEQGYAPLYVDSEYLRRHTPQIGGYYVVYKDGYRSFSPAAAFEEGYTRI